MPVAELLTAGVEFDEVFVDLDEWRLADDHALVRRIARDAVALGVPVWGLDSEVLRSVADAESPRGVLATAPRRVSSVAEVAGGPGPVLVLVDIADPGNAGTLVRTAEAAGASGVVMAGTSTDVFGPKAVRSAAGSIARLAVAEESDVATALAVLRDAGRSVLGTVVDGGAAPDAVDLSGPVAIVLGSEAHGLGPQLLAGCDALLTIPMAASVESVNVAIAGAVVLFEAARQRRSR